MDTNHINLLSIPNELLGHGLKDHSLSMGWGASKHGGWGGGG